MPVRLTPASSGVTGPRLRGTAPRARLPRAARAFRRVIEGSRAALIDEHPPRRIPPPHLPAPLRARPRRARWRSGFLLQRPPRPPPPPARGALGSGRRWQDGDRPRHRRQRHRLAAGGEKRRGVLGQGGIRGGLQPGRQPGLQLPALPRLPAVPLPDGGWMSPSSAVRAGSGFFRPAAQPVTPSPSSVSPAVQGLLVGGGILKRFGIGVGSAPVLPAVLGSVHGRWGRVAPLTGPGGATGGNPECLCCNVLFRRGMLAAATESVGRKNRAWRAARGPTPRQPPSCSVCRARASRVIRS